MPPQLLPKLHGATTHFPVALTMAALLSEFLALILPRALSLRTTASYLILLGALSAIPAALTGLFLTKGEALGHGALLYHHLFVWPALGGLLALGLWRAFTGEASHRTACLLGLLIVSGLMSGAGYWGGEMLFTPNGEAAPVTPEQIDLGRKAFAMSCAECHGDDAHGGEGPDLHALALSDSRIASTVTQGIKGEMPAFGKKYDAPQVAALISYLRTLK